MATEQLIKETLKQAKWSDQLQRMTEVRKWIDYYNYRQHEPGFNTKQSASLSYMSEVIARLFPNTASEMIPYIRTYPLTEQIINDTAILFSRPPILTVNPAEKLAPESPVMTLFNAEIVDKPMLFPTMLTVNRYVNLCYKIGVMPRWYEAGKQIEYIILTPDKCVVTQDPDSPSHITSVIYQVDNMQDTAQATQAQNRWMMVTPEEYTKLEIGSNGGIKIISTEPNPYKKIVVSWFQNQMPLDGFWIDRGQPIVDCNESYNVNKTLEKLIVVMQSYSTLVTWGIPVEKTITWGVNAVLNLGVSDDITKQPGDAKYITPDPKISEVSDIVEGEVNSMANYAGLSKEAYRKDTNTFSSGYQLELSKQDVLNQAELEKPYYTQAMKDLMLNACLVFTTHSGKTLEAVKDFNIDYQPMQFKKNPLEVRQIWNIDKMLGIKSPIDMLMELNPEMSREAAIEKMALIQKELNQFKQLSPFDEAMKPDTEDKDDNQDSE